MNWTTIAFRNFLGTYTAIAKTNGLVIACDGPTYEKMLYRITKKCREAKSVKNDACVRPSFVMDELVDV